MKLFSAGRIGMYLDAISHKNEKRKGGETKVIELSLRIQPFTSHLALAMDEVVKGALFKRTTGDPVPHVKALDFSLPVPRQQLYVYATVDTVEASIMFDQAKVSKIFVRTEKGVGGYGCVVKVVFGPVDKRELEFVEAWRGSEKWIAWEAAVPSLDFLDGEPDEDEDDEETTVERPKPMFDDPRDQAEPARRISRRKTNGSGTGAHA